MPALACAPSGEPENSQFLRLCAAQHNRKKLGDLGRPRGAFASAILYSSIETAKLCGLEPYYYLRYVLTKLPTTQSESLANLLPWNINTAGFGELTAEDASLSSTWEELTFTLHQDAEN
jgi:hypothetical protein